MSTSDLQLIPAEAPEVEGYFKDQGFSLRSVEIRPRTTRIRGARGEQEYFIKLASNRQVSLRLDNEVAWNRQLEPLFRARSLPVSTPEVIETGTYQGLSYYVTPWHSGKPLLEPWAERADGLPNWLDRIIDINLFLLENPDVELPRDKERTALSSDEMSQNHHARTKEWYDTLPAGVQQYLAPILEKTLHLSEVYKPSLNHHDFVPWHMLEAGARFLLIDGEHATARGPRFYDICYFFHRVATKANDRSVADEYIQRVYRRLTAADQDIFVETCLVLLASRIIGGYFDAQNDHTSFEPHQQLAREYLAGTLLAL